MKNQFKRETASLGLIDRISIFLTIVVVIITIFMSFITYKNMKDRVIEIYEGNLSNRTDERIEAINSFFDNKFENLKFLALQPEVYSMNWNTQRNYLLGKSKRLGFEHIFIMDNEGIGYYVETNVIKNQSSEEFSKLVLSNEKYISEPFMEYTQNRSIVTMTYSITDKDGNKLGAICGAVNLTEINKKIEEFVLGENGFGIVINKNGEYVAAKDMQLVHSKVNFYNVCSDGGDAYDISLLKGNGSSGVGFIKLDNVRYCASYKNIDINGWKVIIAMPEKEVLEQSNTYLESQVLNIIALVFLMLGITIILYNWISNERKSYKDGLTKLYNRDKYNEVIKKLENNSKDRVVVICFDLNDFKHVNDAYGHSVGDSLLISFSKILANTVGRTGFISRIGGDEFTGILKNATDDQIKNIIMQVENLIKIHNKKNFKIKLSTAYGYAIKEPNEIIKMETLVNEADKKMYENKEKYKNSLIKKSI